MRTHDPEREMVKRALPLGVAATVLAAAVAWFSGGSEAALSAAIGGIVVLASSVANGYSLSWAARTSPTFLALVAGLSFFVRMAVIFGILALLSRTGFFSPVAFILSAAPIMVLLLSFEAKLVMGPLGRHIQVPEEQAR